MECCTCGYRLFNLSEARCPECGTPFNVTSYTFNKGAVRFGCPHCEQVYDGNDDRGLISPPEFECAGCRRPISVASMRVLPVGDDLDAITATGVGLPWENLESGGVWRRWWETCKLGMFQPDVYYRRIRDLGGEGISSDFGFLSMVVVVGMVEINVVLGVLLNTVHRQPGITGTSFSSMIEVLAYGLAVCGVVLVALLLGVALLALFVHVGVWMFVDRPRSVGATMTVVYYALCPAVWMVVPGLGPIIFWCWSYVVCLGGLAVVHRTTRPRAFAAILIPGIVLLIPSLLLATYAGIITASIYMF